jgi:hypothetical protein
MYSDDDRQSSLDIKNRNKDVIPSRQRGVALSIISKTKAIFQDFLFHCMYTPQTGLFFCHTKKVENSDFRKSVLNVVAFIGICHREVCSSLASKEI